MIFNYEMVKNKYGNATNLKIALQKGELFKLEKGIYSENEKISELEIIIFKNPKAVFTSESAYYYHDLTDYVPDKYFRIWRLEFLLRINHLPISNTEKLYEIGSLFDNIGYPSQWHSFLYYMNNESSEILYQKYCEYMRTEISELN
jgi:hypothetical protein